MRHTKNSHNITLFHTLLHSVIHHTLRSGAYTHIDPHTPISKSHFFARTDPLYIQPSTITSLELAQRLTAQLLTHSIRIHTHSLTRIHSLLYSAAGPLAIMLYTVKYSMDTKLISLAASIMLVIIWYVIYI